MRNNEIMRNNEKFMITTEEVTKDIAYDITINVLQQLYDQVFKDKFDYYADYELDTEEIDTIDMYADRFEGKILDMIKNVEEMKLKNYEPDGMTH